jgi:MFS superfamily sulfate permease-like transporter
VRFLIDRIERFIAQEQHPVRQVILDARAIPSIDITAAEQMQEYVERLRARGIEFVVAKAHLPLRETLAAVAGHALDGRKHFSQLADAVAEFEMPSPPSTNKPLPKAQ